MDITELIQQTVLAAQQCNRLLAALAAPPPPEKTLYEELIQQDIAGSIEFRPDGTFRGELTGGEWMSWLQIVARRRATP